MIQICLFVNFTGPESLIIKLIEKGANINVINDYLNSPLVLAVYYSEYAVSVTLDCLKKNWKIFSEFDKAAEMLIEKGADVHVVGEGDVTVLEDAKDKGKYKWFV